MRTALEQSSVAFETAQAARLARAIAQVIKGKDEVIELALTALIARGHLLLEDVPGVGKTTLAQALARSFHCTFQRIQFTSDLLPSDVIGTTVYNQSREEFEFKHGPLFANVVLADEINRTTPKTQSALLEAMNEARVTVENHTHSLPQPFIVLATQNPVEHHGTYPLPESQLDRFLIRVRMGYPARASEKQILRESIGHTSVETMSPVMEATDVAALQAAAERIRVEESLIDYALEIAERTRNNEKFSLGVSTRGTLMLHRAAQARALLKGRDFCFPDDFKQLVIPVFAHRVVVNTRYLSTQKKSEQAAELLREILDSVPVPM
ncbi:MAG TPA: MoxR family ATPase [Candidatus Acidoferrales bacterium]|nr:MoxR family ATPase [Candidatus Acidoferrales bacterium]